MTAPFQALRSLSRVRALAVVAIVSLGITIALNTTMYAVVDALVFPRTSMVASERVYVLRFTGDPRNRISNEERRRSVLEEMPFLEAATGSSIHWDNGILSIVQRGGRARAANVQDVEPNYFVFLGAPPALGRLLWPEDALAAVSPVVVSERFWNEFFSDLTAPNGEPVRINGTSHPVVGVVANDGLPPQNRIDVWVLPSREGASFVPLNLIRVKDGVSGDVANQMLRTVTNRWARETNASPADYQLSARSLFHGSARIRDLHVALILAVMAVLGIAVLNIANLQLARGYQRAKEIATRAAIGASRKDLVLQLTWEGLWLALGGLAIGTTLSLWAIPSVSSVMPLTSDDALANPQLSWRVLAAGAVLAALSTTVVGLVPALRLSRVDISAFLKSGSSPVVSGTGTKQHRLLLTLEVAAALSVLTAASLIIRAAKRVYDVDVGYDVARLAYARVHIAGSTRTRDIPLHSVVDELKNRIESSASITSAAYLAGGFPEAELAIAAFDDRTRTFGTGTFAYRQVTPGYLSTLGVPMIAGQDFSANVNVASAIIDQRMARACWGSRDPIGNLVKLGSSRSDAPWVRVIGVSRSFIHQSITPDLLEHDGSCPSGNLLVLMNERDTTRVSEYGKNIELIVSSPTSLGSLTTKVISAMQATGEYLLPTRVHPLSNELGLTALRARYSFVAVLFGVFATAAVGLAALGLFAVAFYLVTQRTHEFGVRLALGASKGSIVSLLLAEARFTSLLGLALGLLLSLLTTKLVQSALITPLQRFDTMAFALSSFVLLASQLAAMYLPARWASAVDPVEALRHD